MTVLRLARTVWHLRVDQQLSQVRYRLGRVLGAASRPRRQQIPAFAGCRWPSNPVFAAPGAQNNAAAALLAGSFTFINETRSVGWPPRWDAPGASRLWAYNLHYFEFLWALDYEAARELVSDWIRRHPAGSGRVGWEPYPTSQRLVNWCAVFFGVFREHVERDEVFRNELWHSIAGQALSLEASLEWHLRGNHLLENVCALYFTATCFDGPLAAGWIARTGRLVQEQIAEQILPDGGHFERSPMYHARVVYLLAMLSAVGRACHDEKTHACILEALTRATAAMERLCHPDGDIALLNDSAFRIANPPDQLRVFVDAAAGIAPAAPPGVWALPDSGYFGYSGRDLTLVCDAARVGPDYIPGHAHGDIFSFELSLFGRRVIVDAGVHDYVEGPMRAYCRSTRAHNTVTVDGEDQCEFWGVFRVARRGRPHDVHWHPTDDGGFRLDAWHDGYARLTGRPRHRRCFVYHAHRDGPGILMVKDEVSSAALHDVATRIHLAPECIVGRVAQGTVHVSCAGFVFTIVFAGAPDIRVESSWYCPEFGRRVDNRALVLSTARVTQWTSGFAVVPSRKAGASLDLKTGLISGDRLWSW